MNAIASKPRTHRHLAIWKDIDKNGKLRAYHFSTQQFRSFPLPLADAEAWIAQGLADQIPHHPFKGPRG
jgi:hypothetical protein